METVIAIFEIRSKEQTHKNTQSKNNQLIKYH